MQFLQLSAFMEVWQLLLPTLEAHVLTFQYRRLHQRVLTKEALMSLHW